MNGEVNGTMEEVAETPNSGTIKHRENADSIKAMESEEYENGIEHCNDSKNSYHLQNDNSQGPPTTNNLDSTASNSNDIVQQQVSSENASANNTSAQESVLLSPPNYIYYNDNNESGQHVNNELKTGSNITVEESTVFSPQNLDNNFNVSNDSGEQHVSSDLARVSNIATQESDLLSPQDCNYDIDNNSIDSGKQPANSGFATDSNISAQVSVVLSQQDCNNYLANNCNASNDSGQQPTNSECATDNDISAQKSIALSQQDCNNDLDNNCNASNDSGQQPENSELATDSNISAQQSVVLSSQDCKSDLDHNCNASNDSDQQPAKSELATDSNISGQESVVLSPQGCNYDLDNNCNISNDSSQQQESSELPTAGNISAKESIMSTPQDFNVELDDNSNDSYPESMSSQAKSEVLEQHGIHIIDEKNKDFVKICNKKQSTNSQDSYEGTVSIGSDSEPEANDDTSQESGAKNKVNEVSTVENDIVPVNHLITTEIHEIESDNDDCVVVEKAKPKNRENSMPLRRSRRAIKRKRYTDDLDNCEDDSDVEEPPMKSLRRSKPIVINDTKTLVEMAARQMKSGHSQNQKKEPTVVIIDTNSSTLPQKLPSKAFGLSIKCKTQENLCQNMYNYGTTVTSVSNKANSTNNSYTPPQPSILPSLTDDMFVVEAPSFIVPYVYEKPSLKPFREFVDILGKELEEQKAKADKDLQEKCKAAKEKQEQEKQEKREKGEDVEESEEDIEQQEASQPDKNINMELDKKKKIEKKERRKRNIDEDDASWDGESSAESDDDIISDEEGKTVIIKEKDDFIDFKDVTELTAEKVCSTKTDNYFDCSLGKFFVDIGLNLVQEYVQSDLLKQQNRKLYREKKTGHNTKSTEASIASLSKNIEFSKENNAPYKFKYRKCEFCSFKTESMLVLAQHLEIPHMKNNCYKCNYCPFEIRSPNDILRHMEVEHNMRGKLERAPSCHQCVNCPFEDNGKGKLARHQIPCAKKFKPELNLTPPVEWEPPAKIPKISRARNNVIGLSYQNAFVRTPIGNTMNRPSLSISNMTAGMITTPRPRAKIPVPTATRPVTRIFQGGVMIRQTTPVPAVQNLTPKPKSMHQPSISITPLPRQPQPVQHQPQPQPSQMNTKGTFVICEICDGYIKDLEQLRNHMQWIHKVKIHPKMIYNRPPLNCQKCQFRFFTDQGLERHLLGSHGLVTSSMQEAANKGRDAGRCPVCGRVYQWKLLNHVGRDHNLTLKPAHLSYKCTVCTATFSMYKQFENHVYSAHSVVAKRVMDKNKPSATPHKATNDSLLKPLKINDEITIIPQPTKISLSSKEH